MKKNTFYILVAFIISIVILNIGIILGSQNLDTREVFSIIHTNLLGENITTTNGTIVWNVRLPRVLLAFLVGFSVSVSGCIMQQVLRNPLASTYTMGVSSGASLGIVFVIVIGVNISLMNIMVSLFGFLAGLIVMLFVMALSKMLDKTLNNNTIVLVGFVVSIFCNSLLMTLAYFNKDDYQKIINYQLGSFSFSSYDEILLLFVVLVLCLFALFFKQFEIDILNFGDDDSKNLGVNVGRTKVYAIIISSILCGISVAFAGIIAFVDLIAPHIARRFVGQKIMVSSIMSGLIGGSLMVMSDLLSRTLIPPREIPVGIITSLIGVPFFLIIFMLSKKDN